MVRFLSRILCALSLLALVVHSRAAHADPRVGVGVSVAGVMTGGHELPVRMLGAHARFIFAERWSVGLGYDTMSANSHYENCTGTDPYPYCFGKQQLVSAIGELHFFPSSIIDPWVRVGVGTNIAERSYWYDFSRPTTVFPFVEVRAGLDVQIAGIVALGLDARGAKYAGSGHYGLGLHAEVRF